MKALTIETEQYIIRPFRETDAVLWQVWDFDSKVQAYMPEPQNKPQDITDQYKYMEACGADEEGYYWSIETKKGETIGTVSLTDIHQYHKIAELGIVIGDKSFWGKGVATEVVRAVVTHAFQTLDLKRITAEVEAPNIGMSKVLEKAGFTQDGLFVSARVKNGVRIDVKHFGIVQNDGL